MSEQNFQAWDEAFSYVRERNRPDVVTVDGKRYKLYPSGRALCAVTMPMHSFEGAHCDCSDRQGETIARLFIPRGGGTP
jgi:hypothetical protein